MDHKELISGLPNDTLRALNEVEDAAGLRHLAGHFGLIILFAVWIGMGWPAWQMAVLLQGIAICFLFTLEHEATHKTPFKTMWINEWVGRICGFLIAQPFEWFRYFHLAHHRYTNIPDKDPELMGDAKPKTFGSFLVHVSGIPYWVFVIDRTIGSAFGRYPGDYVPQRAYARVRKEAQWMLMLYGLTLFSLTFSPLLFWIWFLPCFVGQPFLRIYLLAEHGRCAFVANMLENTRTTFTNSIVRFLAWNMPYHVEHHTLPMVPFHKLPDLHEHMRDHLLVTSNGYTEFTKAYVKEIT